MFNKIQLPIHVNKTVNNKLIKLSRGGDLIKYRIVVCSRYILTWAYVFSSAIEISSCNEKRN